MKLITYRDFLTDQLIMFTIQLETFNNKSYLPT